MEEKKIYFMHTNYLKTQTCSLVYNYVGGRVVGNAQTVCKIQ